MKIEKIDITLSIDEALALLCLLGNLSDVELIKNGISGASREHIRNIWSGLRSFSLMEEDR